MKKILALVLASVMVVSSTICVSAAEEVAPQGSASPTTKELMEKIEELNGLIEQQQKTIDQLVKEVRAGHTIVIEGGGGGGSSSGGSSPAPATNAVSYGGTVAYQGGKIEINGGRSNATFTITSPGNGVWSSAHSLANKVGGSLVTCISTSSPGVAFQTAKVNFFVSGVQAGDNIAAYQNQGGSWVQLPVVEIRKDHVVVTMTRHGDIAFVRVPVLAHIGG